MNTTRDTESVEVILKDQRRRRWPLPEKAALVRRTYAPGMSVSLVARQEGVAASLLFQWRKLERQGELTAVSAGEAVVPASELAAARAEIAKLQRVLGTLENEILKEGWSTLPKKSGLRAGPYCPGKTSEDGLSDDRGWRARMCVTCWDAARTGRMAAAIAGPVTTPSCSSNCTRRLVSCPATATGVPAPPGEPPAQRQGRRTGQCQTRLTGHGRSGPAVAQGAATTPVGPHARGPRGRGAQRPALVLRRTGSQVRLGPDGYGHLHQ